MMEAARTSEKSVYNYFTRQYIPEDKSEKANGTQLTGNVQVLEKFKYFICKSFENSKRTDLQPNVLRTRK
jgi:hypothetical protein